MTNDSRKNCFRLLWIAWLHFCRWISSFIERLFESHTRFITNHHRCVIIACLLFVALMAVGAVRFNPTSRNEELFIPQGSQAFEDLDKGEEYFQLKFRVEEFIVMPKNKQINIFNSNAIFGKALELHNKIKATKDFEKACVHLKHYPEKCLFVSSLEVFDYDMDKIKADNVSTLKATVNKWLTHPQLLFRNGRPAILNYRNLFGSYSGTNKSVSFSNAVRMIYYMVYADSDDDNYDTILDWENRFLEVCKNHVDVFSQDNIDLFYFSARTRDDAILESTLGDLPLFSVAFILMVGFCLFVFMRIKNPVTGHLTVGIAGIFVIVLGVVAGFGLSMWIGTNFVAITGILMFLVLGIGMDNMFIIIDAMDGIDPNLRGPERLVVAMKHVGGSITMTTTTDLIAFAVSTISVFPAYAALSIFFAYAMIITLFLALLTADIKRIESGRRDVFPCCVAKTLEENTNPWSKQDDKFSKRHLIRWAGFIMKTPMKIFIFLLACCMLASGIYGTTQISQKFHWKKIALDGSYFRKFADIRDEIFPSGYGVSVIIPPKLNYSLPSIREEVRNLDRIACENPRYLNMTVNWLVAYQSWLHLVPNTSFNINISDFLRYAPMYNADITFDRLGQIEATRVIFFYENDNDAINQAEAMKTIRKDLEEKSELPNIYPISIMFIYSEQFAVILSDTIRNLAICAGAILLITLPYLTHPGITIMVCLSFVSLLFELLGLMAAWGVSLDAIAMMVIITAIGFSVDYTCHIAHSYTVSQKDTPEERVVEALGTMGNSVLNGGLSTFLGMLVTAFSAAEGFRIFFKMVFGIVLLGLIHGLIFLPVLLSIFVRHDLREDMKIIIKDDIKTPDQISTKKQSIVSPTRSLSWEENTVQLKKTKYDENEAQSAEAKVEPFPNTVLSPVGSPNSAYEADFILSDGK